MPKISVGETFPVAIISGIEKVWIRGGVSRFSVKVFVSMYRKISLENTFLFQKSSFIENFHASDGGGITVLSEPFVSQDRNEKLCNGTLLLSENFRMEILLFLRKILVSESFMDEKGGITFFRRKFLVSQCRNFSCSSLQCFRNFGVSKNFMRNRGYHKFPSKFFDLTVPKHFVKEPFSVSLISGIKKCYRQNRKKNWHDRDSNIEPTA